MDVPCEWVGCIKDVPCEWVGCNMEILCECVGCIMDILCECVGCIMDILSECVGCVWYERTSVVSIEWSGYMAICTVLCTENVCCCNRSKQGSCTPGNQPLTGKSMEPWSESRKISNSTMYSSTHNTMAM